MEGSSLKAYKVETNQQQANRISWSCNIILGDKGLLSTKHLKLNQRPGKLWTQYMGQFKALLMVECNSAKLELQLAMKVHLVFNVALLKKY